MKLAVEENHSLLLNITTFGRGYKENNCTEDDGLPITSKCIFILLSSICGIFAIGGNLALLVAFYRSETVHGRNNCFVVSLAAADFLIGLLMTPLYICYAISFEPYWLIKLEGFLWIVTVTATTHSLSAVSIDRMISVVQPLRYYQVVTETRCRAVIYVIWLGAFIFGFPRLILNDFKKLEKLWIACSVATVAVPVLIMCICYGRIFTIAKKQSCKQMENTFNVRKILANKKAAVTIGIIVCLFVITFLPSVIVYFMLLFENDICKEYELNDVWLWAALVSFTHSSANPWVYGLRYRELRKLLKAQFKIV